MSEVTASNAVQRIEGAVRTAVFLTTHCGALLAPWYFSWSGVLVACILYVATGLGVTVGLHRLLTHRSFETTRTVRCVLATLGSLANQGGVLEWVAIHRAHHQFADRRDDPHSPAHGWWHSQISWYLRYDSRFSTWEARSRYVKDLEDDAYLRALDKWFLMVQVALFAGLWGIGSLIRPELGPSFAIYGVFVRIACLQQVTSLVNSAAHSWGYRTFDTRDRSTNTWWVAALSFGEGWHNNHHAFPWSAAIGHRWWELDPGYWVVRVLQACGLAWNVRLPADAGRSLLPEIEST